RWLLALLGSAVISFEYAGVQSGQVTRGLRPFGSPEILIPAAQEYFSCLRTAGITLDSQERANLIVAMVNKSAASVGGGAIIDPGLLAEVTNLVEMPTPILGSFNQDFLVLPRDVLISTMKKHQRYFPVEKPDKSGLLPYFIAIRNGDDQYLDIVTHGNEHVLGARFADANFFVREDIKQPLEYYRDGLKTLIFQTKLGSMLDKSVRMLTLAQDLAVMLGLDADQARDVARAVFLAKADLTTQMVTEMTSLQGIIGREYALRSGENQAVAFAIGEQYQSVPPSKIGMVVALADRIDSLTGLFAAGLVPSGAKDPFGLRRAAIGTVQPLIEYAIDFDLRAALDKSAATQPVPVSDEVKVQIFDFITGRLKVVLNDQGYKYDVVDAVLAVQSNNPAGTLRAVRQLMAWVARPDWSAILDAYARCVRIVRSAGVQSLAVNPDKFEDEAERGLYAALRGASEAAPFASIDELFNAILPLIPAINIFFDKVLVMADDPAVRQNRLGLLQQIAALSTGLADLSKLEGF
ncbi:MAG: glycine--tRNA ligase subunit beta, partial [Chloroflexota bacterium]